jgi:hypothetical protein
VCGTRTPPLSLEIDSMKPFRTRPPFALVVLAGALVALSACSDDDPTSPEEPTVVGTWEATSFTAIGLDFIADGMTLTATLTEGGTYTLDVTDDQVGICEETVSDCTRTGPYLATGTMIILSSEEFDDVTFSYTVSSTSMTWGGAIEGIPVAVVFAREG